MTSPRKRGRPARLPSDVREAVVYVRLSAAERAQVDAAAERARRTVGEWARLALLDASATERQRP